MSPFKILAELIKSSEGCKLTAYQCPAGIWTIGYGCTGADIKKGLTWTQEQADAELDILALDALTKAMKASPVLVLAPSNKLIAIADFIFNLGIGNYKKSTLKKYVDQKNWLAAAGEIKKWDKAGGVTLKGLTVRRKRESELLLS
jgi:lysozyme